MSEIKTFTELTSVSELEPGAYAWEVPTSWQQGKGAFGGLVAAACIRAMRGIVTDEARKLRSLSGTMCGPAIPGEARIDVKTLRVGAGTSALTATISQGDEIRSHFVGVFGTDRTVDGADWREVEAPEAPPWREVDAISLPPGMAPQFTQHVDFRVTGAFPFSGATERRAQGWVQFKDGVRGSERDDAFVAGLADCWWPTTFAVSRMPRPTATIAYTLEILGDWSPETDDEPLFHIAHSPAGAGGYAAELRELWDARGNLVALNQQTFTIIK